MKQLAELSPTTATNVLPTVAAAMPSTIQHSPEAGNHLRALTARQRTTVFDTTDEQLVHQPGVKTRNRKPMKVIETADATGSLGDYAGDMDQGTVIVTNQGQPVAALVPIENPDLETASLSTNRKFLDLIERSRARVQTEGAISSEETRWRLT